MAEPTAAEVAIELRVFVSRMMRRLREVATSTDLSPSQTSILSRLLKDGPASVSDLARAEGVRPQSLGATVALLDGLGFVTGQPDPHDGRRTILSLTDEARATFLANRTAKTDWLASRIDRTLSPAEVTLAAEAIAVLGRLLDGDAPAAGESRDAATTLTQKEN